MANDTFKLCQIAFTDMTFRRRYVIKPELKPQYKELCSDSNPVTEHSFGDDLNTQLREIDSAIRMGKQVARSSTHPYTCPFVPGQHHPNAVRQANPGFQQQGHQPRHGQWTRFHKPRSQNRENGQGSKGSFLEHRHHKSAKK